MATRAERYDVYVARLGLMPAAYPFPTLQQAVSFARKIAKPNRWQLHLRKPNGRAPFRMSDAIRKVTINYPNRRLLRKERILEVEKPVGSLNTIETMGGI